MLPEAAKCVSSVLGSSANFPDLAADASISEDEIVEDDTLWDLKDLTFKDNCEPFASPRVEEFYRTHSISASADIWFASDLIKEAFLELASGSDETSFANVSETYVAGKAE